MPMFKKNDILKYYEVLGVQDREGLICPDMIDLEYITDLFDLNHFGDGGNWLDNPDTFVDPSVADSLKEVSEAYGLLYSIVNEGFWYETKDRQQRAMDGALGILDDLSKIDVTISGDDEKTAIRKNNLKEAILSGICCAGDIITCRFFEQNADFNSIYLKISDIEAEETHCAKKGFEYDETPEPLMRLYYLMAYSKFADNGSNFELFDSNDKLTLSRVRTLVRRNLSEGAPFKGEESEQKRTRGKVIRMSHFELSGRMSTHHD